MKRTRSIVPLTDERNLSLDRGLRVEVSSPLVVRNLTHIKGAKIESSFMFILTLDLNSHKVSGLTIWRGDGRNI